MSSPSCPSLLIPSFLLVARLLTAQSIPGNYPTWIGDASVRGAGPSAGLQGAGDYSPEWPEDSDGSLRRSHGHSEPDTHANTSRADPVNTNELNVVLDRSSGLVSADQLRHPLSGKALGLLRKAQKLIDARKHTQAIAALRESLSNSGAAPYAYSLLGQEYLRTWDFESAVFALQEAVQLLPLNAVDHANLGFADMMRGQLDPAESELLRALELQPKNPQTHLSLGILRLCQGAHETEAEEQFKIAARDLAIGHLMLAKFYKLTKRPDAAENQLQTFLRTADISDSPVLRQWLESEGDFTIVKQPAVR